MWYMIRKVKILIIWTLLIDEFEKNLSCFTKSSSSDSKYRIYGIEIGSTKWKNKIKNLVLERNINSCYILVIKQIVLENQRDGENNILFAFLFSVIR